MDKQTILNIPNSHSTSATWIEWHKALRREFGKKKANYLFVQAWDKRAGAGSDASTNELREYMKDNGVTLDTTTLEDIGDTAISVKDFFGDIFEYGKIAGLVVGGMVIVSLGMILFNVAKNPVKAAETAMKFKTPKMP